MDSGSGGVSCCTYRLRQRSDLRQSASQPIALWRKLKYWGGIEKSTARSTSTHSTRFVLSLGYTLGYNKLASGARKLADSHRGHLARRQHYPAFAATRQTSPANSFQNADASDEEIARARDLRRKLIRRRN